ncbi:MAG: hypothetical protein HN396_10770, partial [Gemmatimonadales bacterium]|nr:hypothetical protein [Gemmatimonadales bacterium]
AIAYPNRHCRVMAHEEKTVTELFGMYRRYRNYMPEMCRIEQGTGARWAAKMALEEPINSVIEVLLARESKKSTIGRTGRGMTIHALHLSEYAHMDNPEATMTGLLRAVPRSNPTINIVLETTAKAYGDPFFREWERAKRNEELGRLDSILPVFIAWTDHHEYQYDLTEDREEWLTNDIRWEDSDEYGDERDLIETHGVSLGQIAWRRDEIDSPGFDKRKFKIEYPRTEGEAFQGSGGNYLDGSKMQVHVGEAKPPVKQGLMEMPYYTHLPSFKEGDETERWMDLWGGPKDEDGEVLGGPRIGHEYIGFIDASENKPHSGDFNTLVMLQRQPLEVVAIIRGTRWYRPETPEFSDQCFMAGLWFNNALLVPESNTVGQEIIRDLLGRNSFGYAYPNLGTEEMLFVGKTSATPTWGLRTTPTTKRAMMSELKILLYQEKVSVNCIRTIQELMSLQIVNMNGNVAAPMKGRPFEEGSSEVGHHDDCAMALAGAYYVHGLLTAPRTPQENHDRFLRDRQRRGLGVSTEIDEWRDRGNRRTGFDFDTLGV